MKRFSILFLSMLLLFCFSACASGIAAVQDTASAGSLVTDAPLDTVRPNSKTEAPETVTKMSVDVSGQRFTATLADNEATRTLVKMIREKPVVIHMSDYAGFEKVGSLGTRLPASNSQITTQAGDIMLYNGDQIVIFYGSHSWSYTKIGKIEELNGLEAALGSGDVTVTFSIEE